jgi:hypothetical protein
MKFDSPLTRPEEFIEKVIESAVLNSMPDSSHIVKAA